jgi:hypothetical protein
MKRFVVLSATLAALVLPATPGLAAGAARTGATPDVGRDVPVAAPAAGASTVPPEYCFAIFGSDVERLVCSSG